MKQSSRIRIAIAVPKYGLVGGGEEHTAQLTNRLSRFDEYDIHLYANQWTNVSERINTHKIPIVGFPKFLTTISFAQFVQNSTALMHFDIMHTHERIFWADLSTLHWIPHRLWIRDVRKKKKPTYYDLATMRVERHLVRSGRLFAAVSTLTKEIFLQEYPEIDPERIRVIHPGVDLEPFSIPDRAAIRHEVRRRYGLEAGDTVAVFVSMNYDIKGLDYLIRGIARFRKTGPRKPIKLVVVGKSSNAAYVHLARALGIENDVIYAGTIPHERIAEVYLASDLFAMPSRFDTFGLTVLEAMAASLPVIISENVGAKDVVKQGRNGFIVEDGRQEEQIGHALEVLSNANIRSVMSREAQKTAAEHGWDASLEKYLEFYDEILEAKRAVHAGCKRPEETHYMAPMTRTVFSLTHADQKDHRV
ncbi:MAG TPA: glycosyltransferase family 4 protein [Syntrophales bacterium]|nr:glycosyltransferase family 4 protein [Syntrophales bacterium]